MKVVIQRVSEAKITINNTETRKIGKGLVLLLGITHDDSEVDANWLLNKIVQMRIFEDAQQKMNNSLQDMNGEMLIVSQFTLFAQTKKGNRPSFVAAAKPEIAIPLYEYFVSQAQKMLGDKIKTGTFGADMKINLVNDGPVTIVMDSKNKE